ncbi:MAG: hypothetical protein E7100_10105 [Bacteroidaceae bacterium]|jgi:hypothetical protein|nr:hypothetical protein [Bacteroidaceae bacterium]MBP3832842.1 hypothetical protein [Bacteroidaceae bacterium]MBQ8485758.1 hypothetical protein [Bacteroidaceae bacterium]
MTNDEFLADDLDDEKTIEFIKGYLPQDLKEKFSDDELYYFLDVIDDYYANSGILDAKPDDEGFIDIDLDKVVDYVIKEAKKDEIGEFEHDDILFVVQGEMEYTDTLE